MKVKALSVTVLPNHHPKVKALSVTVLPYHPPDMKQLRRNQAETPEFPPLAPLTPLIVNTPALQGHQGQTPQDLDT